MLQEIPNPLKTPSFLQTSEVLEVEIFENQNNHNISNNNIEQDNLIDKFLNNQKYQENDSKQSNLEQHSTTTDIINHKVGKKFRCPISSSEILSSESADEFEVD